jgi:hypothetical protein
MPGTILDYGRPRRSLWHVPLWIFAAWVVTGGLYWGGVQWWTRWWDWFDKGNGRPIWFQYPWWFQLGTSLAVGLGVAAICYSLTISLRWFGGGAGSPGMRSQGR